VVGVGTGAALVVVDRLHGRGRPAQRDSSIHQGILASAAFSIATHLIQGGLANVHHGGTTQMVRADLWFE
jgi:hypothetical protein